MLVFTKASVTPTVLAQSFSLGDIGRGDRVQLFIGGMLWRHSRPPPSYPSSLLHPPLCTLSLLNLILYITYSPALSSSYSPFPCHFPHISPPHPTRQQQSYQKNELRSSGEGGGGLGVEAVTSRSSDMTSREGVGVEGEGQCACGCRRCY